MQDTTRLIPPVTARRALFTSLAATLALATLSGCGRTSLSGRATQDAPDQSSPFDMGFDDMNKGGGDMAPIDVDMEQPQDMSLLPDIPPPVSCEDGDRNGDESDVDCGGSCVPCGQGERCRDGDDCEGGICEEGFCGIDPLPDGAPCRADSQCASGFCSDEGICEQPGLAAGEPCDADDECQTGLCLQLEDRRICSVQCAGFCPDGLTCFDAFCVPDDYCEAPDGQGFGPGCMGDPCRRCDEQASCTIRDNDVQCTCNPGFRGDGTSCVDIDECADPMNPCGENSLCQNEPGSFTCVCADGYELTAAGCVDIDECSGAMNPCGAMATCSNTPGGFSCVCDEGYEGDGVTCRDIDECADGAPECDANATCSNEPGGFSCACNPGFMGDGASCADVDECADPTACPMGDMCVNTPGGFSCGCQPGFEVQGGVCVDVDECADPNLNNCDANATCANAPGSFSCVCNPGYMGDGTSCMQIMAPLGDTCENPYLITSQPFLTTGDTTGAANDYERPSNACPNGANARRGGASSDEVYAFTPTQTGTYNFEVSDMGFASAAILTTDCADIQNTCLGSDTFDPDFEAVLQANTTYYLIVDGATNQSNSQGSYEVTMDLDECASGLDDCGANATCTNIFGSFVCSCQPGFELDAMGDCVDVDECADPNLNDCDPNATCANEMGDYSCTCNTPFVGDGEECWDPNVLGESCANPFVIGSMPFAETGDTGNYHNDHAYGDLECPGSGLGRGGNSPDVVYSFTPTQTANYRLDLTGQFGVNLYVVTDCSDIAMSCVETAVRFNSGNVNMTINMTAMQTYYIVVDGSGVNVNRNGSFVLSGVQIP